MALLDDLKWRHATKAYDPNKKVSQADLEKVIEAAYLAPSSSGLQGYKLIVISNQEIKEKLMKGALNPDCMRDCSHVLVFAGWDNYTPERIDHIYNITTDERGLPRGRFGSYTDKIKKEFGAQSQAGNFHHIAKQTYIGLGMALAQAAELRIDSTPVEGFDNIWLDEVLELPKQGLKSVSIMYLGYADKDKDWLGSMKKVRHPMAEFLIEVK